MAMNPTFALYNFADGLQFEVASRRHSAGFAVIVRPGQILLRGGESIVDKCADAHSRLRKATCVLVAPIRLFDVLAQGEFDSGWRVFEDQLVGSGTKAKFNYTVLTSDRIGGPMKQIGRGEAASELLVEVIGFGIDDVTNSDHCGRRQSSFVYSAENRGVAVTINQPRSYVQALPINL